MCAPARACLATIRAYDRSPVRDNADDLPVDAATYYRRLREEAGYHVAGCGKFDLHKGSFSWGVDGTDRLEEWGFSAGIDSAGKLDGVLSLRWDDHPTRIDLDSDDVWELACEAGRSGAGEPAEPYTASLDEQGLLADHVEDYERRRAAGTPATFPTTLPDEAYVDNWIARRALELLDSAPDERPWHLVVNFAGPHSPFDVTGEMHGWYRDPDVRFPEPVEGDDATDHQGVRRNYAAMIENVDRRIGDFLDALERHGERKTLVVFASDHGELLGDHGQWGKGSPYRASAGVPLIVAGSGVEARTCDDPVSLLDLHATFLDYAGLASETDSRSLRPVLEGEGEHREHVTAGYGDWRLVFDGRHTLVRGWTPADDPATLDDRPAALFDHDADPQETENLLEEREGVVRELVGVLAGIRED